jgi:DNA-binding NarL/FixJ family response regulator
VTRCLIADDHPGVVVALTELLTDAGFEVVGVAGDGLDAVALAGKTTPACAVVDYRMPGLPGADLLKGIRAVCSETAIVVYTAEASLQMADEALAAGAAGIVLKESPLADVLRALDSALAGIPYLDSALVFLGQSPLGNPLTPRESEVLALVADGFSYEEIGGRLGIGDETARTHLKKACARLDAVTRTEAVAKALRLGWIH